MRKVSNTSYSIVGQFFPLNKNDCMMFSDKLSMTKAHKKMAVFLTQLADAEDVDVEDLHSHIIAKSKQLFKDGY